MRRYLIVATLIAAFYGPAYAGPVGGGGGPITVDSTTFVPSQSVMGTDGGVFSDTLPPIASTTTAAFRMTKYRAQHVNLRDNSGVELGTTGNPVHVTGGTTVSITTVTVTNSSFSVTGSTVNIGGTVPVTLSGNPSVSVSNTPTVFLSTTNVTGSTVTITNTGFAVTNNPSVTLLNVATTTVTGALPAGTNNIGTVSGSTVTVSGTVPTSIAGTVNTYVTNPTTSSITGTVSVSVVNIPTTTISGTVATTAAQSGAWSVNPGTGTYKVAVQGVPNVVVNNSSFTVGGSVNVTGSTVSITGTPAVTVSGTANVSVIGTPSVSVVGTPNVNVVNSTFDVTGSSVYIQGTLPVAIAGTVNTYLVNPATVTINGTPSVNANQAGTWAVTDRVLSPVGVATAVGYSAGALPVPASITDGILQASVTAVAGQNGLNVNIIGGAGAGGTASNYGASFPTAGTAAGFMGPTGLMQAAAVNASSQVVVSVANTSLNVTGSTVTVNGTVGVSGLVIVSSASPLNVSGSTVTISGTPNVTVTNTPNVSVTNTPNVAVTNTVGTTLTTQLPVGTNNIGTVTGSTVTISGTLPVTFSGTVDSYVVNPVTATVSGTVGATQSGAWSVSPGTGTYPVSGTVASTQSGSWAVSPVGVTTVTFNGIGQPVTQSGAWTVSPGTGTYPVSGTVAATQSGSWTNTAVQSGTRWAVAYSTTSTTAVLSSTGVTTNVSISTPIAGISSQTVRVLRLVLTADAATTITFYNGSTSFGESYYLSANGSIVLDATDEPWYITSSSNGFSIHQSGSANIGVRIWYTQS